MTSKRQYNRKTLAKFRIGDRYVCKCGESFIYTLNLMKHLKECDEYRFMKGGTTLE